MLIRLSQIENQIYAAFLCSFPGESWRSDDQRDSQKKTKIDIFHIVISMSDAFGGCRRTHSDISNSNHPEVALGSDIISMHPTEHHLHSQLGI